MVISKIKTKPQGWFCWRYVDLRGLKTRKKALYINTPFLNAIWAPPEVEENLFDVLADLEMYGKTIKELADIKAIREEERTRAKKECEDRATRLSNTIARRSAELSDSRTRIQELKEVIHNLEGTLKHLSKED